MMNPIPVLFITYNRLEYTKKALDALLKTNYPIKVFWWDNGSTDETLDYLLKFEEIGEKKIAQTMISGVNRGINIPFNEFIKEYKEFPLLAKVDNDTIVDEYWLDRLVDVLDKKKDLDVVGAFMQRPPSIVDGQPWTFQRWVDSAMRKENIVEGCIDYSNQNDKYNYLAYNSYTGGTGVLFRTKIFWEHGLLYEKYPCLLGDWTSYQRLIFNGKNIAWYSGTTVQLLNIKEDGVSLDETYKEYDEEMKKVRDEGNKWYSKVGGAEGIKKLIEESGGRERLVINV